MKRKTLRISAELLVDWLKNPACPGLTSEGVPADARIVYARWIADDPKCVELTFVSDSFEPITDGSDMPEMDVRFHRTYPVPFGPLGNLIEKVRGGVKAFDVASKVSA